MGTVHFAHLVELPGNHIGFFTIYDGPFDKYAQDFADKLGPAFDLIFKFTKPPAADAHVEECGALHQVGEGPRSGATRLLLRLSRPPGSRRQGSPGRRTGGGSRTRVRAR